MNGASVYSTTVSVYNGRDQVIRVKQYSGQAPAEASSTNVAASCPSGTCQESTMSYDGYGRLQSKHVPEQDASTATVYAYNLDDTIHSVTDARGASATYSYDNHRRLVNGISYSAPSGIAATSNVTFGYDAVGSRTSMTDGSGTVTYLYNQLSQLSSETRQFGGSGAPSGNYTIGYEYNLAGELKKITDPSGAYTEYGYDSTGRMLSVSGEGLGTSQYASSMQYRAWGGLKSVAYENGTSLSLSYNARGMATHYAVGGVKPSSGGPVQPEGGDFHYYADGRVKFVSDLRTDASAFGLHDRAYSYDHAARLKEAYSGSEARNFVNGTNSGIPDGAFRQTYGYDAWSNLTSRTGRFWSEDDSSTDSFDSQNRNPLWEYDDDGRLVSTNDPPPDNLPYQALRFTYDASGQRAQSTQTTSRHSPNPNSPLVFTTAMTNSSTYDGDGMLVQSVRTRQLNNNTPGTTRTFHVRSSLLGAVIAEYDSAGVRQNAYVFVGSSLLAQQQRMGDGPTRLMWLHINPLTGDGLDTDTNGVALDRTTVDPMGVNVGDTDPFPQPSDPGPSGGEGMSQSQINAMVAALIPGWGGPKCAVDGAVTSCRLAFGALSVGAAVLANPGANTTARMVVYQGKSVLATYRATYDGYQGYIPVTANYTGNGNFVPTNPTNPGPPTRQANAIRDTNFATLNGVRGTSEAYLAYSPQKTDSFQTAVDNAVAKSKAILHGDNDCSKFFGSNAVTALEALAKKLTLANNFKTGITTNTGISQSYDSTIVVNGPNNIVAYRLPTSAEVYRNGPFFMSPGAKPIGGYPAGSVGAQITSILHELAHDIITDPKKYTPLIPNDGTDTSLSSKNTQTILKHCAKEIFNAAK